MIHLAPHVVHVWPIDFNTSADFAARTDYLDSDEKTRAAAFKTPALQHDFVLAHAALRFILSQYLAIAPDELRFKKNAFGKPEFDFEAMSIPVLPLHFNLSHTKGFALVAVAQHAVGVDIETSDRAPDALALAQRFFAPTEYAALLAMIDAEQKAAFFRIWTRKEAFIKAIGKGLSQMLDSFVVSAENIESNTLIEIKDPALAEQHIDVRSLAVPPPFLAAVALAESIDMLLFEEILHPRRIQP